MDTNSLRKLAGLPILETQYLAEAAKFPEMVLVVTEDDHDRYELAKDILIQFGYKDFGNAAYLTRKIFNAKDAGLDFTVAVFAPSKPSPEAIVKALKKAKLI